MHLILRSTVVGAGVALVALTACAKGPSSHTPASTATATPASVMVDLGTDESVAERKIIDLAKAMPDASYDWRPAPGVRSVREVFLHLAGENYLVPAFIGTAAPASTHIVPTDMKTVEAFEMRPLKKDSVIAELQQSFAHLHTAMSAETSAKLAESVQLFGTSQTRMQVWIGTITHLHEHLGQAIAYARSNKVVPPWSK